MERIEIIKGNKKIQIDYNENNDGTFTHLYTDYIDNGFPVEVLK